MDPADCVRQGIEQAHHIRRDPFGQSMHHATRMQVKVRSIASPEGRRLVGAVIKAVPHIGFTARISAEDTLGAMAAGYDRLNRDPVAFLHIPTLNRLRADRLYVTKYLMTGDDWHATAPAAQM